MGGMKSRKVINNDLEIIQYPCLSLAMPDQITVLCKIEIYMGYETPCAILSALAESLVLVQ